MITYPCAKINLGLNIVARRNDGYHDLETVFYPIRLSDKLDIKVLNDCDYNEGQCVLAIDGISIEGDIKDNLVVKAYNIIRQHFPEIPPVNIKLTKNIPSQAGMGGGSSDCAYTITALNKMFNLGMSIPDMQYIASKIGADCPFFINPLPSFATGIGEHLRPIHLDLSQYYIGIVKPQVMISTREAFAHVTPQKPTRCCLDIIEGPIESWRCELVNDFENSIAEIYPEIAVLKQRLYDIGAIYASMSGSGSALYGIFKHCPRNFNSSFDKCFTAIV